VANSSNKNIRIGHWIFPARKIISINGIADSLRSTFDHYISKNEIFVTGDFREAILYLKKVKPKINVDAILGRPPLPKEVLEAQEKKAEQLAKKMEQPSKPAEKKPEPVKAVPDPAVKKDVPKVAGQVKSEKVKPLDPKKTDAEKSDSKEGAKPVIVSEDKKTKLIKKQPKKEEKQ